MECINNATCNIDKKLSKERKELDGTLDKLEKAVQYLSLRGKDKRIKGRDKWFERNDPVDTPVRNTYKQRRNKFSSKKRTARISRFRKSESFPFES